MSTLKKIEILVNESNLQRLLPALRKSKFSEISVISVCGHALNGGFTMQGRVQSHSVEMLSQALIIVVLQEERVQELIETVDRVLKAGQGLVTGTITVTPIESYISIGATPVPSNAVQPA